MWLDSRIPVQLVAPDAEPPPSGGAVLVRVGDAGPAVAAGWAAVRLLPQAAISVHGAACACCGGRSGLAQALGVLFAQRARAELPLFDRVVLSGSPEDFPGMATILRQDVLVSGRFQPATEK